MDKLPLCFLMIKAWPHQTQGDDAGVGGMQVTSISPSLLCYDGIPTEDHCSLLGVKKRRGVEKGSCHDKLRGPEE